MKVNLSGGRVAKIGVRFGNEQPTLRPSKMDFRSVRIDITLTQNEKTFPTITGISYCNSEDQFDKFEGKKLAMKRLLKNDPYYILSREDRQRICPILLYGKKKKPLLVSSDFLIKEVHRRETAEFALQNIYENCKLQPKDHFVHCIMATIEAHNSSMKQTE
jgi:hypothetical protein